MITHVENNTKSKEWLVESVELVEKRGFTNIKSKLEGYDDPISFEQSELKYAVLEQ